MRLSKCSILASLLLLAACRSDNSTALLIEKPTLARPIVAVVPVNDKSRHELAWNLSNELTGSLRHRFAQHGNLYLLGEDQVYAMTRKSFQEHDPFESEIQWVKKRNPQNEFVAFFELVEHRETPLTTSENEESPAELFLSMRVRVFDLRKETPSIILEEIVAQCHHIPQPFTRSQVNQVPWGDEMFEVSPLGLAHDKLCQEIAQQVEDYILLACKS